MAADAGDGAFRVGLLGHGTVGVGLRGARSSSAPARSRRITGLRPQISGVLTRSRGDFDEIVARLATSSSR